MDAVEANSSPANNNVSAKPIPLLPAAGRHLLDSQNQETVSVAQTIDRKFDAPLRRVTHSRPRGCHSARHVGWARLGSNQRLNDYESSAMTWSMSPRGEAALADPIP